MIPLGRNFVRRSPAQPDRSYKRSAPSLLDCELPHLPAHPLQQTSSCQKARWPHGRASSRHRRARGIGAHPPWARRPLKRQCKRAPRTTTTPPLRRRRPTDSPASKSRAKEAPQKYCSRAIPMYICIANAELVHAHPFVTPDFMEQ